MSARDKIHSVIAEEEASFSRTLVKGIERFKKLAAAAQVGAPSTAQHSTAREYSDGNHLIALRAARNWPQLHRCDLQTQ